MKQLYKKKWRTRTFEKAKKDNGGNNRYSLNELLQALNSHRLQKKSNICGKNW